jgi:hypothetical protein
VWHVLEPRPSPSLKPSAEESEIVPKKPIPHTTVTINRTSKAGANATGAFSGLNATTCRHNIVFASFAMATHGASLLGGSQRLFSPNVRATFLSQATDKRKRLHNYLRQLRPDHLAISAIGTNRPYHLSAQPHRVARDQNHQTTPTAY